jgi:fibronectin-binding autotransporter adhesin
MVGPRQTVLRPYCWCAVLVGSAMLVAAPAALAQDATWLTTPASDNFSTPTNWTPGAVPTGFATFGGSSVTTLTFSGSRNIDGFIFSSGAPAYTFNLTTGVGLRFHTDGIINNSANAPTFNVSNSPLIFDDSSTAGNAIINLNAGSVQFLINSTAGTAQLNAATGTTFDFTGTLGPASNGIFSAGSISGDGNFDLGVGHRLVVGSNDLSTIVSGTIVSGAITKVGTGTLTLSGSNTYAGGTTLSSGTLMLGNSDALGSGDLSMAQGTTLSFDTLAAYNVANNISIAGDPIFNVAAGPAQTVSGVISDTDPVNNPGIVEKNGAGTLILSGDNTYSGGTILNAGTLQVGVDTVGTPGAITSSAIGTGTLTFNGGTLQAGGNFTVANAAKLNTAGGTIDNFGYGFEYSGVISNGNGTTGVLQLTDSFGGGVTLLSGANTYSGGTKVIGATLQVNNNSSVGTGLVTLENGLFQVADTILTPTLSFSNNFAINNTPVGSAIDVNGYSLTISGNIADGNGPGKLTVVDSFGGGVLILTGTNTYSGGTDICNCGTLQLGTSSTMGSILGAVTNNGQFDIVNANTTGITSIFNDGGLTNFYNANTASAMTITNRFGGTVAFHDSSTAGGATIINNLGGSTEFGVAFGTDAPRAGTATITNNNFGLTEFNASSRAENAKIITNNGGELDFWDTSTAEKATITTNPGGKTFFNDNSTGDMARFITSGSGFVDFSGSTGPNGDGRITAGSIEGSGSYYIGGGNTLVVGGNNLSTEASGVIADNNPCGCTMGPGALEKVGTGTLVLSGTNTYTGGTTITAGTLQLGNGGATMGSILGNVTDNATLAFNRPDTYQFDGAISGSGVVQQNGGGTTILTAVNSYGGGTTINAGRLSIAADANLGAATGGLTFNGGTLQFTNNLALTLSSSRAITLQSGDGGFEVTDGNVIINQAIGGSGALTKSGSGFLLLNGNNTYGGGTTISAGTLVIGNGGTTGSITGNVVDNGLLTFNRSDSFSFDGLISGSGGMTKFGAGTLTLTADNTYTNGTVIAAGTLQLGNGGTTGTVGSSIVNDSGKLVFNRSNLLTFGAQIFGAGSVTQFGTGTTVLTGDNTYTGGTTITAGTLQLGNGGTTGSILGNVTNNATLAFNRSNASQFNGVISGSGAVQQNGPGTTTLTAVSTYAGPTTISAGTLALSGAGSIANSSGVVDNAIFDISGTTAGASIKILSGTGNVALGNQTLTLTNASGTFAGAIGGNGGLVKQGPGLFTLSGTNTYLGATAVAGGELRVNGSVASAVNVQSGATLSGGGSVGGLVTVQSGGTLSAGQSPGTLTLGALNLNTGSTSVFELGSAGVVGGASNDLVNVTGNLTLGGTLSVNAPSAGYYRLFNYGTLTASSFDAITGSSNGTPTVLTNVPNQVNLSIAAAGQRIQFWDGADQTGNGVVNGGAGTWNAANTNWTGAPGQANINDSWRSSVGVFTGTAGTVTIAGAQAFDTLQFSTTGYVLNAGAGGQLQLAGLSGTGTINTDGGVVATINAPIVNGSSQSLTKVGGGTLILTAANTYSGGTTISGGTLQLGNGGATGSIVGNVTDNGIFAIKRSDAFTFSGTISGSGAFQQLGTGTTILTADNNYTGGTTISAGTLQLGNGGTTGSIAGNVLNNGVLAVNRSNAIVLAGVISGTGAFQQIGGGTTTLSGAHTYTGATTISNGTLTIAAGGSITSNVTNSFATFNNSGTVAGTVTNFGTFNNNAGGTVSGLLTNSFGIVTNAGQLNGGATLTQGTLTNNNLISGAVTIVNGTVNNNATITGAVTNADLFNNNAGGTVSGLLTNTGTITTNAGQLNGGAKVTGGLLTNNGLISGALETSGGFVNNNATITGTVVSSATFNNNSNGTVSGLFTGTAGINQNTGQLNGGVNMTGGTLNSNGTILNGLTNAATVNVFGGAVNGAIANNAGGTFNVGGTVTSDNIFANAANATLAIGASGAYTLQGMLTNSGAITVASGGQLIATVGGITNNAGGSITVALGGTVKDDLNNAGVVTNNGAYVANVATNTGAGSITNAATGTWTGNVLSNAAAIANNGGWSGNVASNTGAIDNNKTWTGTVSNAGTFNNNAGGAVSGLLTNTAGTTVNNGALNGGANVAGGIFTGSGTVANLTVSGGIFAPGNGTPGSSMTVAGNLAFQSGAMYLVALNPTTASFANVGGTASLNGTAAAVYLAGNYLSKKYTILTAAGGVNGTFGSISNTNVPANFSSTLSYDANNAYIDLTLNFNPSGLNINQQNVANTLVNFFNGTGGIPAAFGALTPGGLTQVSGELATASQQTTFDAMNLFLGLLTDPFVAGRGNGIAPPTGASQFAEENDAANAYAANGKARSKSEREAYAAVYRKASIRDNYDPRWSVWAAGYGGSQTTDGNTALGSNTATSRVFGTAVGADYLFSPRTIAGFALAGGGTNFSVANSGTGRSDLFQAGAFVRHTNGPAYISAALAYGWQDVTTDRTITAAGGGLLRATFNANAFSGRVESGYRFVTPWMAVGLTPYAAGQFTTFDLPAYAEQAITGANTFALGYAAKSVTASRSEFGLRSDKSFAMQDGIFTLRGRAAWAHNFNPDRNIAATFQTLPGASFVVNGAAQASDAALVTGSAEMKWLNGLSLAATFEGEFSSVTRSYAGKGVARYAW